MVCIYLLYIYYIKKFKISTICFIVFLKDLKLFDQKYSNDSNINLK